MEAKPCLVEAKSCLVQHQQKSIILFVLLWMEIPVHTVLHSLSQNKQTKLAQKGISSSNVGENPEIDPLENVLRLKKIVVS
jgi:hypothetical protein